MSDVDVSPDRARLVQQIGRIRAALARVQQETLGLAADDVVLGYLEDAEHCVNSARLRVSLMRELLRTKGIRA
jgi:hypothetical protein